MAEVPGNTPPATARGERPLSVLVPNVRLCDPERPGCEDWSRTLGTVDARQVLSGGSQAQRSRTSLLGPCFAARSSFSRIHPKPRAPTSWKISSVRKKCGPPWSMRNLVIEKLATSTGR